MCDIESQTFSHNELHKKYGMYWIQTRLFNKFILFENFHENFVKEASRSFSKESIHCNALLMSQNSKRIAGSVTTFFGFNNGSNDNCCSELPFFYNQLQFIIKFAIACKT